MVPTIFIPCQFMPSITSTKLDRGLLRRLAAALGHNVLLSRYSLVDTRKASPGYSYGSPNACDLWMHILKSPSRVDQPGR